MSFLVLVESLRVIWSFLVWFYVDRVDLLVSLVMVVRLACILVDSNECTSLKGKNEWNHA